VPRGFGLESNGTFKKDKIMSGTGGSPIKLRAAHIVPPVPPSPFTLTLPEEVLETATPDQLQRIALIELEFSHRVAKEITKAYGEVLAVLREGHSDKR
jgi:hypothetical protein